MTSYDSHMKNCHMEGTTEPTKTATLFVITTLLRSFIHHNIR